MDTLQTLIARLSLLGLVFGIHALYYNSGVIFDASPLVFLWQYIDPFWLTKDLSSAVHHFHIHPPLFNLFLGGVLWWSPLQFAAVFQGVYLTLGFLLLLVTAALFDSFRVSRLISVGLIAAFFALPSTMLYEHSLYYAWPILVLLTLGAFFIYRFERSGSVLACFVLFLVLAGVGLLEPRYHLGWFVLTILLLVALSDHAPWKIVLCAVLPLLLLIAVPLKNYRLFGTFTTSSWFGMTVAQYFVNNVPLSERRALAESGIASPLVLSPPFAPLEAYSEYLDISGEHSGVSVLDEKKKPTAPDVAQAHYDVNFNHGAYIAISEQYLRDSIALIKRFPDIYLKKIALAWQSFSEPAGHSGLLNRNRKSLEPWIDDFETATCCRTIKIFASSWCFITLLFLAGLMLGGVLNCRVALFDPEQRARGVMLAFCLMTVTVIAVGSNMIDASEANRFRFELHGLFLLMFGSFFHRS